MPLIPMSPGFRTAQLAEIELGRLVMLRAAADLAATPGLGLRADALSAQGDLTVGVLRLRPTRFERCALDDAVIAIDLEYLLEADLESAVARAPGSGDLVVAARRPAAAGIYVAQLWGSAGGLLDIASAVIRPFTSAKAAAQVVLGWRLVEREQRTRTLFERPSAEPYLQDLPRRVHGEDDD
ncbi:MAG TPA: hypothetical protein VLV29_06605 [Steroidobacteraceae bacterium]|nr:hypothetical protein [Steroidobacteraceae bacterium]